MFKTMYTKYEQRVEQYLQALEPYEESVKEYKAWAELEELQPEPGLLDFLYPADIDEPPTLLSKPIVPSVPEEYNYYTSEDFEYFQGYGILTSSFLKTHIITDDPEEPSIDYPFRHKYFGLFGQGTESGLGYDINRDIFDNGFPVCSYRYFSINLMPEQITTR